MARPGHAGSRRPAGEEAKAEAGSEEAEEDPLDARIARSGCAERHRALQECMAEQRDWRRCQPQVRAFGECMARRTGPRPPPAGD